MIISFGKKPLADTTVIREIQRRNERMIETFYNECKKYFMSSYKAVFSRKDIKPKSVIRGCYLMVVNVIYR